MPTGPSYGAGISRGFPGCKFRVTGPHTAGSGVRGPGSAISPPPRLPSLGRGRLSPEPVAKADSGCDGLAGDVGFREEGTDLTAQLLLEDVHLALRVQDAEP